MMPRLGLMLIVVVVASCAPRLSTDTSAGGEDGAGGDTGDTGDTGTSAAGDTDGGESSDDTTEPFLGVRGVVIFDPVPESWDDAILDLRLYGSWHEESDGEPESFGHYREFVTESPVPFSIDLDPSEYDPDTYGYSVTGFVDWNGDGEENCEEYRVSYEHVDPTDGVPVTLYAAPNGWECPDPPPPNPCLGVPDPQPGMWIYEDGEAVYVDDTLHVELRWDEVQDVHRGYRFELLPEQQMPGTYELTVEEFCWSPVPGECMEDSTMHEVVVEVVSLDEICLSARFVELTEGGCMDIYCGGFVVPIR